MRRYHTLQHIILYYSHHIYTPPYITVHVHVGRAFCLEYRVSWVRVPPEAAHFFYCLGCAVLLCLVCFFDLACFFLSSFSSLICIHIYMYMCTWCIYMYIYMSMCTIETLYPLSPLDSLPTNIKHAAIGDTHIHNDLHVYTV